MANQLKNILNFTAVPAGGTVSQPHLLNEAGVPLVPDFICPNPKGITVAADGTNVTVTNTTLLPLNVSVLVESWHTIEREFGGAQNIVLNPQPFIDGTDVDSGAAALLYSMFFGTTTGTGSSGNDYAATVAVKTSAGTGRVPFPRTGPNTGAGVRVDNSSFTLLPGVYRVTATVHTTEPGQLELELNGASVDNSCFGNANPTSGGHPIVVDAIVSVPAGPAQTLAVINPAGNATALTITPADGNLTHAYAQKLVIQQLA